MRKGMKFRNISFFYEGFRRFVKLKEEEGKYSAMKEELK